MGWTSSITSWFFGSNQEETTHTTTPVQLPEASPITGHSIAKRSVCTWDQQTSGTINCQAPTTGFDITNADGTPGDISTYDISGPQGIPDGIVNAAYDNDPTHGVTVSYSAGSDTTKITKVVLSPSVYTTGVEFQGDGYVINPPSPPSPTPGGPTTPPSPTPGGPTTPPSPTPGGPTTPPSGEPTTPPSGEPTTPPSGEPTTPPSGEPTTPPTGEPTTPPAKADDLTHIGTGLMAVGVATAAVAGGIGIKNHVSNGNAPVGGNSSVLPYALTAIGGGVVAVGGAIFFGVYGCYNGASFLYKTCPNNKPAEAPTTAPTESNQAQGSAYNTGHSLKSAENVLSTKAHAELSYYEQISEYVQNSVSNAPKAFVKGAAVSSVTGVISGGLKEALKDTQYAEYTEYLDAGVNIAGAFAFGGPLAGTIMATTEFAKIATQGTQYEATVSNISTAVSLVSSVLGGAYTAGATLAKPLARGVGQGVVQTAKYALGYEQEQPKAEEVAEDLETGKAQLEKPQAPKESWSSWVQRGVAYGTSTVGKLAVDGVSYSAKYAKDTASSWVSQTTSTDVEQGQAR